MAQGVLQMRQLGRMGRAGNAFFQYLFLRTYVRRHNLELQVPAWFGETLFGFNDARPVKPLPRFEERMIHGKDDARIPNLQHPLCNVDVVGYFQYHTSFYRPDREFIQSLFAKPVDSVLERVSPAVEKLRTLAPQVIGVHFRRGDYGLPGSMFYLTPTDWYVRLLDQIVTAETAVFVATEDRSVLEALARFKPVTAKDLGIEVSREILSGCAHLQHDLQAGNFAAMDFFPDWWLLKQCDVVVLPNSTFSFSAAMLSTVCRQAYRSDPDTRQFELIDPWDAFPMQFIDGNRYSHVPGLYIQSNPYWR